MRKLSLVHLVIFLCLSVFAYSTNSIASQKDGLLKIYFFDIGQGDSIFIETPNGNQILIDGGPDNTIVQKLGETMPFYDKDIDLVILSHPHADHSVGLIEVLKRYDVKNIIEAKEDYESSDFIAWRNVVKNEGAKIIEAIAGRVLNLGNNVTLTILYPFESADSVETKKPHDYTVATVLKYKDFDIILTGDMEEKVERRLILAGYDLDSDVLKVGHHGSKTSTSEEFLSAVSPEVAVIQVGAKNRYGHPSPEILKRLEDYDIKYYRNDVDGDIKLVSDGSSYKVITY